MKIFLKISVVVLLFLGLIPIMHSCKKEELPTLSTTSITNITATSASSGGNITSDGGAGITERGVCWSSNVDPTTSDSKTVDGKGGGQFTCNLADLNAGSAYHVRAYATNSVGTAYGADLSFTTLGKAPECLTQTATNVTSSGATLNGTVNANYLPTTVTFEYGTSTSYGQSITSAQSPVTGNSITNVSADLSGLTPGTIYHFRVVAVNSIGSTNGNDLSFTTGAVLPTLTTTLISNKTATTVTTGGNITSDGGASITSRGVCWAATPNPTILNNKTSDGTGTGSFTSNITGLTPGMSYYVRAYATNSSGTAYGEELTFTTLAIVPTLTTASITDKTRTTATSGGNVISDGGSAVTARGVCWSTAPNPTADGSHTSNGTGTGIFISSLTSLTPGTTYYVKAFATNNAGTGYGNEISFSTDPYELATLTTNPTISITENIAISGGNITSDGGSPITARGVCWSTTPNPTISGSHTNDGIGTGSFTSDIRCLYDATIYYVRAYATNIAGTAYGNQQSFTTPGTNPIIFNPDLTYGSVSDVDGNCYKTIQIGTQTLMAENLRTTHFNDGTPIPEVTDFTAWENFGTNSGYCWYDNDSKNKKDYGALYKWGSVNTGILCPIGWHVPTDTEWHQLMFSIDPNSLNDFYYPAFEESLIAGGKLKESGIEHWMDPNTGANNESGFTAIPGGLRMWEGSFLHLGEFCWFWSATEPWPGAALTRLLYYENSKVIRRYYNQSAGYSVRCVKDN